MLTSYAFFKISFIIAVEYSDIPLCPVTNCYPCFEKHYYYYYYYDIKWVYKQKESSNVSLASSHWRFHNDNQKNERNISFYLSSMAEESFRKFLGGWSPLYDIFLWDNDDEKDVIRKFLFGFVISWLMTSKQLVSKKA